MNRAEKSVVIEKDTLTMDITEVSGGAGHPVDVRFARTGVVTETYPDRSASDG
jgi:hypothetical protein